MPAARPKHSTSERTAENRQRILEAAEAAFAARGFDGANMREIAAAAGVNKFMLYYHFENKETLFQEVLTANFTPIFQQIADILNRPTSLEETVREVYDMYAELFARKGDRVRPFMARELAAGAPNIKKFFLAIGPQLLEWWTPKILAYTGRKSLPERELALATQSLMIGIVSNFVFQPMYAPLLEAFHLSLYESEVKEHVVEFILGGLKTRLT
jgi:TetR/AcrR family transcriptional regulator